MSIFYGLDNAPDDLESPLPWGLPWLHGFTVDLEGDSIGDMAVRYSMDVFNKEHPNLEHYSSDELIKTGAGFLGWNGELEPWSCKHWTLGNGVDFLETNSDPIWEWEEGFLEIAETCTFPRRQ